MNIVAWVVAVAIPLGLDLYLPVPDDNPLTREKIELGRRLFRDRRLSEDGSISCASCHVPGRAFADARPVAIGVGGRIGRRNVPAIINRAYGRAFSWDGRTTSLEEQVIRPIGDPLEMGSTPEAAAGRLGISVIELSQALASYVRSTLAANSPYDRYLNGERSALSAEAVAGLQIFRGKGHCTACHIGPTFSDELFHNTGIAWDASAQALRDDGRFAVTGRKEDRGAFKTPTLREVARTAPYMHDGSLTRLADVVDFYDGGGRENPGLDREIRPLGLSRQDTRALVTFLRSLSGEVREGGLR